MPLGHHLITNNTVHNNAGAGIRADTEGGPSIVNNIVTNNAVGINVVDPNPFRFDQAVASFNLAFGNTTARGSEWLSSSGGGSGRRYDSLFFTGRRTQQANIPRNRDRRRSDDF